MILALPFTVSKPKHILHLETVATYRRSSARSKRHHECNSQTTVLPPPANQNPRRPSSPSDSKQATSLQQRITSICTLSMKNMQILGKILNLPHLRYATHNTNRVKLFQSSTFVRSLRLTHPGQGVWRVHHGGCAAVVQRGDGAHGGGVDVEGRARGPAHPTANQNTAHITLRHAGLHSRSCIPCTC